ncbi:MAG: hypothetical protein MR980_07985 [Bacteroidales bacterium]|nr:hypothetical protein [Bacteroidales bacterium]
MARSTLTSRLVFADVLAVFARAHSPTLSKTAGHASAANRKQKSNGKH